MSGNQLSIPGLVAGASLEALMKALGESPVLPGDPRMSEELAKSTFTQSGSATTGLTFYDLEAGAKFLYPVLTPLRNEIPRVSGKGGIQANWKAVTGINTSGIRIGVSAGNRGAVMAVSTADYAAAYKGIGIEDSVDFEAQYAGEGFADIRALAAKVGLEALMLGEEILILGGNGTVALGTTPTPTVTASDTGGALTVGTWRVIAVALTLEGFINSSVAAGIPTSITRTNADGSTDTFGGGSAQKSVAGTGAVGAVTVGSLVATVTAVRGAVGYAWYAGIGAGNERLVAITSTNKATITTAAAGTEQLASALPAADNSTNNLVFDGLLTQAMKAGSNAYYRSLDAATLTADGAGGIVEIDAALKHFWDNYRLTPDTIWISSDLALSISQKIMAGNANGAFRIVVNMEQGMIAGGIMVATYLNRFSMGGANVLKVRIHPNMPAGMIFFTTLKLPYPVSGVGNLVQVRTVRSTTRSNGRSARASTSTASMPTRCCSITSRPAWA
jgi:hypothetical protein